MADSDGRGNAEEKRLASGRGVCRAHQTNTTSRSINLNGYPKVIIHARGIDFSVVRCRWNLFKRPPR